MRLPVSGLFAQGWTRAAFAAVAFLSLVQPSLTPFALDLAGWTPNHAHVYANGVAAPHVHPWDRQPPRGAARTQPVRVVSHLCAIHPDGIVPVNDEDANGTAPPSGPSPAPLTSSGADVTFLFDLSLTGSMLPAPEAPVLGCAGAESALDVSVPPAPMAVRVAPAVPPPRA